MSKHTPGPWRIGTPPPNGEQTIGTQQGMMVAVATTGVGMSEETLANARLIAAAPDLLEAAELCRKYMYEHASNTQDNAFDKLCAAIAKATGETA